MKQEELRGCVKGHGNSQLFKPVHYTLYQIFFRSRETYILSKYTVAEYLPASSPLSRIECVCQTCVVKIQSPLVSIIQLIILV